MTRSCVVSPAGEFVKESKGVTMNNDLLNYDDEKTCPNCLGVGRIKNLVTDDDLYRNVDSRNIHDLTIPEFKKLMVECFEMLKQREIETSMKEYNKLTTKIPKEAMNQPVFIRDGKPVSQE